MKFKFIIGIFLIYCFSSQLSAQSIPNSRIMDWSNAGVQGGIPCWENEITMSDLVGDGNTDNKTKLQAYVNQYAGTNTKLIFEAGNFKISGTIQIPVTGKLILMGEGPNVTTLSFDVSSMGKGACFEIDAGSSSNEVSVSNGTTFGSNKISVANSSGFKVGDWLEVDQDNPSVISSNSTWNVSWAERCLGQIFKITAISGNELTLDRTFHISYDPSLSIKARKLTMTEWVGFENFKLNILNSGTNYNFQFKRAANCWLKLIHSEKTAVRHVNFPISANCTVVDSYFHDSWNHGNGGYGYGIVVDMHTTDCLIENNIFDHLRHAMMCKLGANGNVFSYNYSHDPYWSINSNTPSDANQHGHLPHMNLFESNVVAYIGADDVWGPAWNGTTYFRNRHYASDRKVELNGPNVNLNLLGNQLLNGATINNESSNSGTLLHGNIINGSVSWSSSYSNTLANSYYLSTKPEWWGASNWPAIGPEYPSTTNDIPALTRYNTSNLFLDYYCGNLRLTKEDPSTECLPIKASSNDGNTPENTRDDNLESRWSANGIGEYIEFCFGDTLTLNSVSIAFHQGHVRSTYFSILTSLDGISWTNVSGDLSSSGVSLNEEIFSFTPTQAWKLRIVGAGNSSPSNWVSLTEIKWNTEIVGIKVEENELVSVFPNPTTDFIILSSTKDIVLLDLYTISGEKLETYFNLKPGVNNLNLTNQVRGSILLIGHLSDGTTFSRKVIIQK